MRTLNSLIFGVCLVALAQMSYAVPMLTTDGSGNVTGATGLGFDGSIFTMSFVDGTCIELFKGCDSDDDFLVIPGVTHGDLLPVFFTAFISAVLESDDGSLDARPVLASGCGAPVGCVTYAPIRMHPIASASLVAAGMVNFDFTADVRDGLGGADGLLVGLDTRVDIFSNYARFEVTVNPVPTPGSLALLALGLACLGLGRKAKTA